MAANKQAVYDFIKRGRRGKPYGKIMVASEAESYLELNDILTELTKEEKIKKRNGLYSVVE